MEQQNTTPEKLTDKAFSHIMMVSFIAIFICIVCLCSTTYAWFTDSIPSKSNVVTTAECLINVSVYTEGSADPIEVIDVDGEAVITDAGTYVVTLTLPKSSSSGYLVVSAGGVDYYVEHLARHDSDTDKTLTFTITKNSTDSITLTPMWGIYSGEYNVFDQGTLVID